MAVLLDGLAGPRAVALDQMGGLYVADTGNNRIMRLDLEGGQKTSQGLDSIPLDRPYGIAVASTGTVFVADTARNRLLRSGPDGLLHLLTGSQSGFRDGPLSQALFRRPMGLAVDRDGNLFIADTDNNRIRKVVENEVSTVAGDGKAGWTDGPLTAARFNRPGALAFDSRGDLYVADTSNNVVRKIDLGLEEVSTPIGTQSLIPMDRPSGIAIDREGNLFISDTFHSRILAFDMAGGRLSIRNFELRVGEPPLGRPFGLAIDSQGRLYVADPDNNCIRFADAAH